MGGIDVSKAIYPQSVIELPLWRGPHGEFVFANAGGVVRAFCNFYADDKQSFFITVDLKVHNNIHEYIVARAGIKKSGAPIRKIKVLAEVKENIMAYYSCFDLLGHSLLAQEPAPSVTFAWNVTSDD